MIKISTTSERFENPYNRYDEKEMFDKKLWNNFSVAIFDTDTNILSYYETDMQINNKKISE